MARNVLRLFAGLAALLISSAVLAQGTGTGGGTTVNNFGGQAAGVELQADGTLRLKIFEPANGALRKQWEAMAKGKVPRDLAEASPKRMVSLRDLEQAIADSLKNKKPLPNEVRYLAGLTRVENVFFFPETNDIAIAGPAEPFAEDPSGWMVGINSGRPILELQDLIVALRGYPPRQSNGASIIRCSIDPTKEGLVRLQQFFRTPEAMRMVESHEDQMLAEGARQSLGMQNVTIEGVSDRTHFAQVLLEADYRMKLIGIGLENPRVKIPTIVSAGNLGGGSANALERWWFEPNYQCVRVTEDQLAMQLEGQGVKLVTESEHVGARGDRAKATKKNGASEKFAAAFTKNYDAISAKNPCFAQLRNVIDLSIAAAFIQEQDFYGRSGWSAELLMDEDRVSVETQVSPKQVESAANAIRTGNRVTTPIGGGVIVQPRNALTKDNLLKDEKGSVAAAHEKASDASQKQHWWWD